MPTAWDEQTWQEGYARGRFEGLEEGHHLGVRAVCGDLLFQLHCFNVDLALGVYGNPSQGQVLHEVERFVEQLRAAAGDPREGVCADGARQASLDRLADAGEASTG
jgi:hypothetical protein